MNTITKGISWQYQWGTQVVLGDKLSSKNGVMTEYRRQAWPEELIIKSSHRPRRWKEPSSSSNPQSDITSEEHLKILLRIVSTTITSLFSLREYALHEWEQIDYFSIRTSTTCRNYRRSHIVLQRAGFNPHLPAPTVVSDYKRYRVRGAQVHHYRTVTLRRVARQATLDGRGRVVSSYS
jgi:hypothetical protein